MGMIVDIGIKPKHVEEIINGHKLIMSYRPDYPPAMRWSWLLVVRRQTEFIGSDNSLDTCRAAAKDLLTMVSV